jgi:hypothetical protein
LDTGATISGTGLVSVTGSTVFVNTPISIANFALSGYLGGTGTVTLTGTATWSGGEMTESGRTTVAAGAALTLTGGQKILRRPLDVLGAVNHVGGVLLGGNPAPGIINIRPGGIYYLSSNNILVGSNGAINNQGFFIKTGTGTSTTSPINNTGALHVESGTLAMTGTYIQSAGTTRIAAGETLQANVQLDGGTLAGNGTVAGNVTGTGAVTPGITGPGRLTISGNLALLPTGALTVDLNGTAADTQYDQLRVTGTVLLGGALNVSLGYTPAANESFTILDNAGTGAIAGTFAGLVQGATVTVGGQTFTVSYVGGTGNDVVLTRVSGGGPAVQSVTVNDGAAQRSMVTRLAVTFTAAVTFAGNPADAFQLVRTGGGAVGLTVTTATVGGVTVATLTFSGPETENGSLRDGNHTLTVLSSQVNGMAPGNYTTTLYRLFGDADGDKDVDNADFFQFRITFGRTAGQPGFLAYFDFDADGDVDNADFFQLRPRFGVVLP